MRCWVQKKQFLTPLVARSCWNNLINGAAVSANKNGHDRCFFLDGVKENVIFLTTITYFLTWKMTVIWEIIFVTLICFLCYSWFFIAKFANKNLVNFSSLKSQLQFFRENQVLKELKLCAFDPHVGKGKMCLRGSRFFQWYQICLQFWAVCLQFFKGSTASQTHFGFTNIGLKVHLFSSTAIYFFDYFQSQDTTCKLTFCIFFLRYVCTFYMVINLANYP